MTDINFVLQVIIAYIYGRQINIYENKGGAKQKIPTTDFFLNGFELFAK